MNFFGFSFNIKAGAFRLIKRRFFPGFDAQASLLFYACKIAKDKEVNFLLSGDLRTFQFSVIKTGFLKDLRIVCCENFMRKMASLIGSSKRVLHVLVSSVRLQLTNIALLAALFMRN